MLGRNREEKKRPSEPRSLNPAVGFGTSFAGGMALFALGGHWLDVKFCKEPLFTLMGIGLGFVLGGWELWKLVVATNRRNSAEDQERASAGKE